MHPYKSMPIRTSIISGVSRRCPISGFVPAGAPSALARYWLNLTTNPRDRKRPYQGACQWSA
ncbi:hypothetical protein T03_4572 [Trichinella britovi]|uniref:Uncharacterized protein n=1 Tax=Trichinella britovi TaxID=45882 RepID=A0A0V1B232_TRIBR|nr:hypothetical protein T03_4572 [Trichinella britovi]